MVANEPLGWTHNLKMLAALINPDRQLGKVLQRQLLDGPLDFFDLAHLRRITLNPVKNKPALKACKLPVDVLVASRRTFEKWSSISGTLYHCHRSRGRGRCCMGNPEAAQALLAKARQDETSLPRGFGLPQRGPTCGPRDPQWWATSPIGTRDEWRKLWKQSNSHPAESVTRKCSVIKPPVPATAAGKSVEFIYLDNASN